MEALNDLSSCSPGLKFQEVVERYLDSGKPEYGFADTHLRSQACLDMPFRFALPFFMIAR